MKDIHGDALPYHDAYFSNLAAGNPIGRLQKQIAGIVERSSETGQDLPTDHINELKRDVYERGG